jgi:adenylate cyclase
MIAAAPEPDARNPTQQADYHHALSREILLSERRRALALIAVLMLLLLIIVAFLLLLPERYEPLIRTRLPPFVPVVVLAPFIAYELLIVVVIGRRLARGRDVPVFARYFGTLVETSLPSAILLIQIAVLGPVQALGFTGPLLYFLFIVLSTLRLDFWLSAFTGAVAAIELFAIAMLDPALADAPADLTLTAGYNLVRCAILLIGGVLAGWVAVRLRRQLNSTLMAIATRERVTNLFGQHVSPQVAERLLGASAESLNETRRVAVMFVDIRGFTEAASKRHPAAVVARLDAAFAVLVEVVDRHGGIVNKFLGDGFLALFGAPLPDPRAARSAVAAGREMLAAAERDNAGHDWPFRLGIGIHVGDVVTGTIGSANRKEFTVIGDTVNLASRIEAMNKEFDSQLLVSEAVWRELGDAAVDAVPLGALPIRGYDTPIPLWRVA